MRPTEIASEEIVDRRSRRRLPDGSTPDQYVNLYINGRNPMLFRILFDDEVPGKHLQIGILRINSDILTKPGVILTDGNWASQYTAPLPSPAGLGQLDRDFMFARYFHPEGADEQERMSANRRRWAEALIPEKVPVEFIMGIHVATPGVAETLQTTCPTLACQVTPVNFFPTRWLV